MPAETDLVAGKFESIRKNAQPSELSVQIECASLNTHAHVFPKKVNTRICVE